MAKFDVETIARWTAEASKTLEAMGFKLEDVTTGNDAWYIAHRSGIANEAYQDRTVVDAHIKTALEKIFPNAVFKDKYTY